jgi:hypothetical protein
VVAGALAAAAWVLTPRYGQHATAQSAATSTAKVIRTDLVTTEQVNGTIGYGATSTLDAPGAATQAAVAQAQTAVDTAGAKLAADRVTLRDTANANDAVLAADQARLSADRAQQRTDCAASATGPQCAQDGQRVATDEGTLNQDRAHNQQTLDQARSAVDQDQVALSDAQAQGAPVLASAGSGGSTFSSLPAVGAVISQGQTLYSLDGRPVRLLYGGQAAFRVMTIGVSGPDVQQLEQDLIALGVASSSSLSTDGHFTSADADAVRRWQASAGMPQTGVVHLGDVVFEPGPVRVVALHVSPGSPVQAGSPLMDLSSATRVVTVPIDPSLGYRVRRGDRVMVDLPDGRTRLPGTVSSVSTVATQQTGGTQQNQNGAPQATINVTVSFDDPHAAPDLDQAPVTVDVTTQSANGTLAVPVNALLALAGGGYGLEVIQPGGQHRLVQVQTGIFDSSRVQVSGQGLAEGMTVVVPSS